MSEAWLPSKWTGCSFQNPDFPLSAPTYDENGNVTFNGHWTYEQRRDWRIMMNLPGHEWQEGLDSKP